MTRVNLLLLPLAILVLSTAQGADTPERLTIEREGKKLAFYQIAATQYREVTAGEAKGIPAGVPIALIVKLRSLQGEELQVSNADMGEFIFKLAAGVRVADSTPGVNLLLGCQRESTSQVFRVSAALALPGDIDLFASRFSNLVNSKDSTPEDFFLLGDWIELAKKQTKITEAQTIDGYNQSAEKAWRMAISRDIPLLINEPSAIEARLARARNFIAHESASTGRSANWLSGEYEEIMKRFAASGPLPAAQQGRFLAAMQLLSVKMRRQLFGVEDGKEQSGELLLSAFKLDPVLPGIEAELVAHGFIKVAGDWVSKAEERRLRAESSAKDAAEKAAKNAMAREMGRSEARQELAKGIGAAEKRLALEMEITSAKTPADASALATHINEAPEDVAREAIVTIVSWKEAPLRDPVLMELRSSSKPALRAEAYRMLAASLNTDAIRALLPAISHDEREEVRTTAIRAIWQRPGSDGIDLLVDIIGRTDMPETSRAFAAQLLANETKQNLGLNVLGWRKWWNENKVSFKRVQ